MLTCVDVEIAFTPSPFAIMNPYSISSSVVVSHVHVVAEQPQIDAGVVESSCGTGRHVAGDARRAPRRERRRRRAAAVGRARQRFGVVGHQLHLPRPIRA